MTPVNRTTVRIPTPSGFDIEAWFYQPQGQGPFPAVVMGHGLGAVKVGGLASFAERFCQEGFAPIVIDYRQWGGSEGQQPRDYDVYDGGVAFDDVIEWEVEFLRRHAGV
jgi:dienelactone hydrolase